MYLCMYVKSLCTIDNISQFLTVFWMQNRLPCAFISLGGTLVL